MSGLPATRLSPRASREGRADTVSVMIVMGSIDRLSQLRQARARAARVRAAFLAATRRPCAPLVRTARFAAAERCDLLRRVAERCAWALIAELLADARLSRFKARVVALRRFAVARRDGGAPWPRS